MRRCTHESQKSHVFNNGDCMWVCPDCGAGGGHYDQSTPILGKLYRNGGVIDAPEESVDLKNWK